MTPCGYREATGDAPAIVASLPLVSVLGMIFLWQARPDAENMAVHSAATFWYVLPSLPMFLLIPRQLLGVFGMDEPAVVEIGVQLLRVLSVSGIFIAVALTYTGALQGTGDTKGPLYISIVSQVMVPLGICFFIQQTGTLEALDIWIAILCGHFFRCLLSVIRFRQGVWRGIVVDIGAPAR